MAGTGFVVVAVASEPVYPVHNFVGIIFCLFFCYTFPQLTFLWAVVAGNLIVAGYTLFTAVLLTVSFRVLFTDFFYMFSINLLGMVVCYSIELMSRKDYMLNKLLRQAEKEAYDLNVNLELRVKERTRELYQTNQELKRGIEREKGLEGQLFQAQKMESVGQLAGGVAHDYNNISGIIIGYSELAMRKLGENHPIYRHLTRILEAARRATDITRQLLAFAREQTVSPKVIDLNKTIESMLKILGRLIGEDVNITWLPGKEVWPVKIDPIQVDQILANLCVNARDAIIDVGKITIETGTVKFNQTYCDIHTDFVPGEYSMLAVSDDGQGMSPKILEKIFEPFFTTKEIGRGTGLGLATVYGIVKQNEGFINVYSEPDQGTTFKIYLSRHKGKLDHLDETGLQEITQGEGETILMVEDDQDILEMGTIMLEELGYKVLAAGSPAHALDLGKEYAEKIELLLTDVIMPEMNGRQLAKNLGIFCPDLKILFMSGYTANIIADRGVLDKGVNFLPKPFSKLDLSIKIRQVFEMETS